ncbi:MerR family transcriptional regulator [Paenibacillus daejeonensis]|uniref:MerR family transcriptional regulator n=1 Tax=Paenibacillus daejeonensis TaxID=135193 RepID=UPI00037D7F85|nr:MerR family transcriptional regulator [Paenibacillus daejeonensis]
MDNPNRTYTVGEFAALSKSSVRTLHYYDDIGLLRAQRDASSGHRVYRSQDIFKLQQIISLKFLGYRLEEIEELMARSTVGTSLTEGLRRQQEAIEAKQRQLEQVHTAIGRTVQLIEQQGELDRDVLFSLIHTMQSEEEQRQWLQERTSPELVDRLFNQSAEEKAEADREFIEFTREVRRLKGNPVDHPEVQALVAGLMDKTMARVGEENMASVSTLSETDLDSIQFMTSSPFTAEEEAWMNEAMAYLMTQQLGEENLKP